MPSDPKPMQMPKSSEEFLDQVTYTICTKNIYTIENVFFLQEGEYSANDYVCLVLRVNDADLVKFFGGTFLFQIWKNKKRLYQYAHNSPVRKNIFCSKTELAYMIEDDPQDFVFLVHPFKQQF